MHLTNLCRAMLKSQSQISKVQLPDNIQYLIMYVLGILKSNILSPHGQGGKSMILIENLDYFNYLRFALNAMSPEETLPLFNPWLMSIHDYNLTDLEPPALESLDRSTLQKSPLLLCYNGLAVYLYVNKQCDPYYLQVVFKVQEFA